MGYEQIGPHGLADLIPSDAEAITRDCVRELADDAGAYVTALARQIAHVGPPAPGVGSRECGGASSSQQC